MNQKGNKVDHQILNQLIKDHLLNINHRISQNPKQDKTTKAKANPKHDTATINNNGPEFWKAKPRTNKRPIR